MAADFVLIPYYNAGDRNSILDDAEFSDNFLKNFYGTIYETTLSEFNKTIETQADEDKRIKGFVVYSFSNKLHGVCEKDAEGKFQLNHQNKYIVYGVKDANKERSDEFKIKMSSLLTLLSFTLAIVFVLCLLNAAPVASTIMAGLFTVSCSSFTAGSFYKTRPNNLSVDLKDLSALTSFAAFALLLLTCWPVALLSLLFVAPPIMAAIYNHYKLNDQVDKSNEKIYGNSLPKPPACALYSSESMAPGIAPTPEIAPMPEKAAVWDNTRTSLSSSKLRLRVNRTTEGDDMIDMTDFVPEVLQPPI